MTLRNCSVTEAETYDQLIRVLGLDSVFADLHGSPVDDFDETESDQLPVSLVTETLAVAPGEYWYDAPATGSDPRYRVIEIHEEES
jgi:hypothetical protein